MSPILIIEFLVALAIAIPKTVPLVSQLLEMLKGEDVVDITHEELVARVDAAIAKLPPWE